MKMQVETCARCIVQLCSCADRMRVAYQILIFPAVVVAALIITMIVLIPSMFFIPIFMRFEITNHSCLNKYMNKIEFNGTIGWRNNAQRSSLLVNTRLEDKKLVINAPIYLFILVFVAANIP